MAPAIAAEFPRLPHAAGLMGRGSEVLGYDDSMSTDHTWFARVTVFVAGEVLLEQGESVQAQLTARIPDLFQGVPTEVKVTSVYHYFLAELGLATQLEGVLASLNAPAWIMAIAIGVIIILIAVPLTASAMITSGSKVHHPATVSRSRWCSPPCAKSVEGITENVARAATSGASERFPRFLMRTNRAPG